MNQTPVRATNRTPDCALCLLKMSPLAKSEAPLPTASPQGGPVSDFSARRGGVQHFGADRGGVSLEGLTESGLPFLSQQSGLIYRSTHDPRTLENQQEEEPPLALQEPRCLLPSKVAQWGFKVQHVSCFLSPGRDVPRLPMKAWVQRPFLLVLVSRREAQKT